MKAKIIIVMDGGIIQQIIQPSNILGNDIVQVKLIDYDIDGLEEDKIIQVPDQIGDDADESKTHGAYVNEIIVDHMFPDHFEKLFNLKNQE